MQRLALDLGAAGRAHAVLTDRGDGDLRVCGPADALRPRRQLVAPEPWTWLHQVHGSRAVVVGAPGEHAGARADAAVTAVPGAVLAVHTADCVPILLVAAEGVVGVAHAGWRGLVSGVVDRAVAAVRSLGGRQLSAVLGPHIRARHYEFGEEDLERVASALGPGVRSRTSAGRPALDLTAAARIALDAAGVAGVDDLGLCTADDPGFFSHRARGDEGRQALVAWLQA